MLFNFRLVPIEQIAPWGREGDLSLSWFSLTDGCYWMQIGDVELFRYRDQVYEGQPYSFGCKPYVGYQVVRLWEDVLDMLPSVLAPIPKTLAPKLSPDKLLQWRLRVRNWLNSQYDQNDQDSEFIYQLDEHSSEWLRKRRLSSLHLVAYPNIWIWNDGRRIHIGWDNSGLEINGSAAWTAELGSWSVSVEEFIQEVRKFDRNLMEAMQNRVEQVLANWTRPEIYIDKEYLVAEHIDRSMWLDRALEDASYSQPDNWSEILKAIAIIEAETQG